MTLTRSPLPTIADYAFLSDCHRGAFTAPDASVDWLCVPRIRLAVGVRRPARLRRRIIGFRSERHRRPDCAGRQPGHERHRHPVAHRPQLAGGARGPDDRATHRFRPRHAAHRRPTDDDAEHMLVQVVECLHDEVEPELVCERALTMAGRRGNGRFSMRTDTPPTSPEVA